MCCYLRLVLVLAAAVAMVRSSTGHRPDASACSAAGFFRVPGDCQRFYRCVDVGSRRRRFAIYHFICPPGTVFDERLQVCNFPWASAPCRDAPPFPPTGGLVPGPLPGGPILVPVDTVGLPAELPSGVFLPPPGAGAGTVPQVPNQPEQGTSPGLLPPGSGGAGSSPQQPAGSVTGGSVGSGGGVAVPPWSGGLFMPPESGGGERPPFKPQHPGSGSTPGGSGGFVPPGSGGSHPQQQQPEGGSSTPPGSESFVPPGSGGFFPPGSQIPQGGFVPPGSGGSQIPQGGFVPPGSGGSQIPQGGFAPPGSGGSQNLQGGFFPPGSGGAFTPPSSGGFVPPGSGGSQGIQGGGGGFAPPQSGGAQHPTFTPPASGGFAPPGSGVQGGVQGGFPDSPQAGFPFRPPSPLPSPGEYPDGNDDTAESRTAVIFINDPIIPEERTSTTLTAESPASHDLSPFVPTSFLPKPSKDLVNGPSFSQSSFPTEVTGFKPKVVSGKTPSSTKSDLPSLSITKGLIDNEGMIPSMPILDLTDQSVLVNLSSSNGVSPLFLTGEIPEELEEALAQASSLQWSLSSQPKSEGIRTEATEIFEGPIYPVQRAPKPMLFSTNPLSRELTPESQEFDDHGHETPSSKEDDLVVLPLPEALFSLQNASLEEPSPSSNESISGSQQKHPNQNENENKDGNESQSETFDVSFAEKPSFFNRSPLSKELSPEVLSSSSNVSSNQKSHQKPISEGIKQLIHAIGLDSSFVSSIFGEFSELENPPSINPRPTEEPRLFSSSKKASNANESPAEATDLQPSVPNVVPENEDPKDSFYSKPESENPVSSKDPSVQDPFISILEASVSAERQLPEILDNGVQTSSSGSSPPSFGSAPSFGSSPSSGTSSSSGSTPSFGAALSFDTTPSFGSAPSLPEKPAPITSSSALPNLEHLSIDGFIMSSEASSNESYVVSGSPAIEGSIDQSKPGSSGQGKPGSSGSGKPPVGQGSPPDEWNLGDNRPGSLDSGVDNPFGSIPGSRPPQGGPEVGQSGQIPSGSDQEDDLGGVDGGDFAIPPLGGADDVKDEDKSPISSLEDLLEFGDEKPETTTTARPTQPASSTLRPGSGSQSGVESGGQSGSDSQAGTGSGNKPGSGSQGGSGTQAGSGSQGGSGTGSQSGSGTGSQPGTGSQSGSVTGSVSQSGSKPGSGSSPSLPSSDSKYEVLGHSIYECPSPGFFPFEENCHEFFVCQEVQPGKLVADQLYRCPDRYLFDEVTRRCQRKNKVNCTKVAPSVNVYGKQHDVLVVLEQYLDDFFATPLKYDEAKSRFGEFGPEVWA